jgi:mRNA interferase MazF
MKNSSSQRCKQGEIWLTKVAFEKSPNLWVRKIRPVLIVGNDKTIDTDLIIVPCTSQKARNEFDVLLTNWVEYGLPVPTIARISKIQKVEKRHFIKKIANINLFDWNMVRKKLDKLF